ncbi:Hypothetical protein A7982_11911 [Minicystis rosea]|nr:Hypothetical protein A7982_11911 [Minicystis rosea]
MPRCNGHSEPPHPGHRHCKRASPEARRDDDVPPRALGS